MSEKIDSVYICDWLPPDFGAVGQYSLIFARSLAADGRSVVLGGLSSRGHEEFIEPCGEGSLKIVKLSAKPYEKSNFKARIWWTLRTNTRIVIGLWSELWSCDEIRFTGSPPLFLHWIAPLNLLLRKRLVYRITDFHPECLIAARGRPSWWLGLVYRLTRFWRRRVTAFEVLGEDQKARLIESGINEERISIKPDRSPVVIDERTVPLKRPKIGLGKVLLLYSGNWGVAHDYSTFLEAYRQHHREGSGRVVLWLNAVGAVVERIEAFLRDERLPYLHTALVPLEQLASLLITPDAHLITLSDAFVGYVLPSKVHGCITSNKPILFIGSDRSDVHRLCLDSAAGYERVSIGDVAGCIAALEELAKDEELRHGLRSSGTHD
jgi:glycosyltransferase involved in cell wall biosynthesis